VYGRLNVNVALNRPTFMSSVLLAHPFFTTYGPYLSSKANDGNKDQRVLRADSSCAMSLINVNPWWGVDLGAALVVVGVLFTNRAENFGNVQ